MSSGSKILKKIRVSADTRSQNQIIDIKKSSCNSCYTLSKL